jgi:IMP dehydrogenase
MQPLAAVCTAAWPCDLKAANATLTAAKANYLCAVDASGALRALTTRVDLIKNRDFPDAASGGQKLLVGAAVTVQATDRAAKPEAGARDAEWQVRCSALAAAGVDVVCLDARHGDTDAHAAAVRWLKHTFPEVEVVGGNVANAQQARRLLDAGVDGLRVGMGAGSVSTSQEVKAIGRAQLSAVYHVSKLARARGVPVLADGGVQNTGGAIKVREYRLDLLIVGQGRCSK